MCLASAIRRLEVAKLRVSEALNEFNRCIWDLSELVSSSKKNWNGRSSRRREVSQDAKREELKWQTIKASGGTVAGYVG